MDCRHCGAALVGDYCHACGQKAIADDGLSLRSIAREFGEQAAQFDFKSVRSLRALFFPGLLTREFLTGHRQPYLNPVKLYLVCAAIFFLAAPLAGFTLDAFYHRDDAAALRELVDRTVLERGIDRARLEERFDLRFQTVYTFSLSISMATVALLLALLFRGSRRPFPTHVVFALHYVGFLYLLAIPIGIGATYFPISASASLIVVHAVLGWYLVVALRRVYGGGLAATIAKTIGILAVTFLVDTTVNALAFLATLRLV